MVFRFLFCVSLLLYSGVTHADTTVKIGVQNFAYFPHYDFTDEESSSLIEVILERWAEIHDITIEFVPLPAKRLEHEFFVSNNLDWIFPANPRWFNQYPNEAMYSAPIVTSLSGTMILSENASEYSEWFTSISVPFGFAPVKYQSLIEQRDLVVFNTPTAELALQMVQVEHVSGADVEFNVAQHYLSNWPSARAMTYAPTLPHLLIDFHIASIDKNALLQQFNHWLADNSDFLDSTKKQLNIIEYWPDRSQNH
ncbi:MAG: hypothetical protein ACFHVJ_08415 [Aestuariibacter sp.]